MTLPNGERRVEVVVDLSRSARGKRRQSRRRFRTVAEARDFYAQTHSEVRRGTHVARERETVAAAVESWLAGRRKLKATTLAGYRNALLPVVASYGAAPVQQLTKGDLDELVTALMRGEHERRAARGSPARST